jgi:tetratricopeptide (TPR) repeat protein
MIFMAKPFRRAAAAVLLAMLAAPAAADDGALARGAAAFSNGQISTARIELLNAIKDDPGSAIAHLLQARVYLAIGNGVAAEAELDLAMRNGIKPARIHHLMAEAWLLQGDPDRALSEADPSRVPVAFAADAARIRGRAQAVLDQDDAAKAEFANAVRLAPHNASAWADLARYRLHEGDRSGAAHAAARAIRLQPRRTDLLVLAGIITRLQVGKQAALKWFDRALSIDPNDVPALLEKSATLADLGRNREMLAVSRKALHLSPGNSLAFYLQAVLAARVGDWPLAAMLMQRTQGVLDDVPAVLLVQGLVAYRTGNTNASIDALVRLLNKQPANIAGRRALGAAQSAVGDNIGAIETLRPLADLPGADLRTLTLLARAYDASGQPDAAAPYLARIAQRGTALALQKQSLPQRRAAAMLALREGRWRDAAMLGNTVVAGAPGSFDGYNLRGVARMSLGDRAGAIADFRAAIARAGGRPEPSRNLAEVYLLTGDPARAREAMAPFVGAGSRDAASLVLAGRIAGKAGNNAEAASLLRNAVAIVPKELAPRRLLVEALLRDKDPAAALAEARATAQMIPDNPAALSLLARVEATTVSRAAAAATLRRATALPDGAPAYADLTQLYLGAGHLEEALATAQAYAQALPQSAAGPLLVGDVLTAAGRDGAAAGAYGRARAINFNAAVATRLVAAQRRAGQLDAALSTARAFATANPHSTTGALLVADVLMQSENWTRAIDSYEAIRRQQGDRDPVMLNNLAWARYRTGDANAAMTLAAKAHAMMPQSGAAADTYGWILFKTGRDRDQGLTLLRRAATASPTNPGVRWHLAQALAAKGDKAAAAGEIRAALALPRFTDAGSARALLARLS